MKNRFYIQIQYGTLNNKKQFNMCVQIDNSHQILNRKPVRYLGLENLLIRPDYPRADLYK